MREGAAQRRPSQGRGKAGYALRSPQPGQGPGEGAGSSVGWAGRDGQESGAGQAQGQSVATSTVNSMGLSGFTGAGAQEQGSGIQRTPS